MNKVPFQKLHELAQIPARAYPDDAGLDLTTIEDAIIKPGEGKHFKTGLAVAIEPGYVGLVWDRSSMGKRGLKSMGGVIDSGYRGEIGVILWNISNQPQEIKAGERIAQLLIQAIATPQIAQVSELPASHRSGQGFGSSGR